MRWFLVLAAGCEAQPDPPPIDVGGQIGTTDSPGSSYTPTGPSYASGFELYSGPEVLAANEGPGPGGGTGGYCSGVLGPGDLDGDGVPDVGLQCDGYVQWYSGANPEAGPFATLGTGDSLSTALGDLDGDGRGEIGVELAGQPWGTVVPGAALVGDVVASAIGWSLVGDPAYRSAVAPSPAGDVDADGLPDVTVLGYPEDGDGDLRVISGAAFASAPPAPIESALAEVSIPVSVGSERATDVGDVDGDGHDDSALPAAGSLYLVSGAAPPGSLASVAWLYGDRWNGEDGSVWPVRVGDLDGDGRAEVAAEMISGSSYRLVVVPGSAIPASGAISTDPYVLTIGRIERTLVACDLDGDGLPELITEAGIWAGRDLLIPDVPSIAPPWRYVSACLGDVDGDGAEDLAVLK